MLLLSVFMSYMIMILVQQSGRCSTNPNGLDTKPFGFRVSSQSVFWACKSQQIRLWPSFLCYPVSGDVACYCEKKREGGRGTERRTQSVATTDSHL